MNSAKQLCTLRYILPDFQTSSATAPSILPETELPWSWKSVVDCSEKNTFDKKRQDQRPGNKGTTSGAATLPHRYQEECPPRHRRQSLPEALVNWS